MWRKSFMHCKPRTLALPLRDLERAVLRRSRSWLLLPKLEQFTLCSRTTREVTNVAITSKTIVVVLWKLIINDQNKTSSINFSELLITYLLIDLLLWYFTLNNQKVKDKTKPLHEAAPKLAKSNMAAEKLNQRFTNTELW